MELKLPNLIVTKTDLRRVKREILALDQYFLSYFNKGANKEAQVSVPKMSVSLASFISENKLNVEDEIVRKTAIEFISFLTDDAPEMHISFASDPPASVLDRLITWIRNEIHPQLVLNIGVRPAIVGGCVIRTKAEIFDFSFAKGIEENSAELAETLRLQLTGDQA